MKRLDPRRLVGRQRAARRRYRAHRHDRMPVFLQEGEVTVGRGCVGWRDVDFAGANHIAGNCWFSDVISVGFGSRIGVGCIISGPLSIGRYCSIGGHVSIGAGAHPMETAAMYTAPLLFGGRRRELADPGDQTVLGHDVWIGAGARIMAGVRVGHGSVIGAGAVVTKDVPDFAVVAGVPARILRSRFTDEVAELLLELAWWDESPEELEAYEQLLQMDLTSNPDSAVQALQRFIDRRRQQPGI